MKLQILLLVFALTSIMVDGQAPVTLSGQVKDESTHDPLEFCNVSYYNLQDSLITGTATDQRGFYSVDLPMGSYKQIISFIGNMSDTVLVQAYENRFQGIIFLKSDIRILEEASIKTNSRSTQIDRDVQVVTPELREGASSAKYVLNKLNGVHYDEYNNAIKVDNDERVIILVDGIRKDQEYIKNMNPERLKKVEVIRDPAGRYGLEGYTAVINVILHKDYMGMELYFQDRALIDPDALKPAYMLVQHMPNATLTYTYDKISVYAKAASTSGNYNMNSFEEKTYNNGLSVEKTSPFSDQPNILVDQMTNDLTLGADFFVNPKHTLSYEGKVMKNPVKNNFIQVYQTVNTFQDGNLLTSDDTDVEVWSSSLNSYNSVFYEGKFNENNTLESNVVYSDFYGEQSVQTMGNVIDYDYGQEGSNRKQNLNYYLEYDHIFNDVSSIMVGYGYTRESLSSDFNSDYEQNSFMTIENRNKLYSYYSRQLGEKITFQVGIAGESSIRQIDDRSDNYFIFLPHLDLKFDFSKTSNMKFKIRSEGKYPTINQTNPYTTFVDFESVQTGNPNLKPEVTNTISVPVTLFQAFTVEPYYAYSRNMIITTGELRPDSIFEYNYFNAGLYSNYGLKSNLTIPFGKSIFFQYSLDLYKSTVQFNEYNNSINDWAMSGQLIYYHQKSKTVAGFIYQKNNNKRILAQGYQNQNIDFWSVLLKRPFLNDKLSITVLYFLPVTWAINTNQERYLETGTYMELKTTDMSFFKNMLMFEVSYRFSKGKVLKKQKEVDYIRENENKSMF